MTNDFHRDQDFGSAMCHQSPQYGNGKKPSEYWQCPCQRFSTFHALARRPSSKRGLRNQGIGLVTCRRSGWPPVCPIMAAASVDSVELWNLPSARPCFRRLTRGQVATPSAAPKLQQSLLRLLASLQGRVVNSIRRERSGEQLSFPPPASSIPHGVPVPVELFFFLGGGRRHGGSAGDQWE